MMAVGGAHALRVYDVNAFTIDEVFNRIASTARPAIECVRCRMEYVVKIAVIKS